MGFSYTEEQELLRSSAARWVKHNYEFENRRRMLRAHAGYNPAHWATMADLGWLALPFSERDGGLGLFVVDATAAGVERTGYRTVDGFRAADIRFVGVVAEALLGDPAGAFPVLEAVLDEATVALCAEAVGAMEALYKTTVDYTKTRKQFGVPISTFQVLQHRMVDMFIYHEQAKSLLLMAVIRLRDGDPDESRKAAGALKAYCGKAGRWVGQQAVQLHGGMGMTDELAAGHYFKRLTAVDALFGNEDFHLQRFAALA